MTKQTKTSIHLCKTTIISQIFCKKTMNYAIACAMQVMSCFLMSVFLTLEWALLTRTSENGQVIAACQYAAIIMITLIPIFVIVDCALYVFL